MPLESIEALKPIIDFAVSVCALFAFILFMLLMYKTYQFCVGAIAFFKFFIFYRGVIRELMINLNGSAEDTRIWSMERHLVKIWKMLSI